MQIARISKITPAATSTLLTMATFGFVGSAAHAIRITKVTTHAMQKAKHSTLDLKLRPRARLRREMVMCVAPRLG
jgi:hypothetical protein